MKDWELFASRVKKIDFLAGSIGESGLTEEEKTVTDLQIALIHHEMA